MVQEAGLAVPSRRRRFSPAELDAARDRTVPDVIADDLAVLFCGINPGLTSAAAGHHFATPGNRFWPALHRGGFTPHQLAPEQERELLELTLGITNVVRRASAQAGELSLDEILKGGRTLRRKVRARRPAWLAVLGVTVYRAAFDAPRAAIGPQPETIGKTRIWVLPNPSGLNAHWKPRALAEEFGRLRMAAELPDLSGSDV